MFYGSDEGFEVGQRGFYEHNHLQRRSEIFLLAARSSLALPWGISGGISHMLHRHMLDCAWSGGSVKTECHFGSAKGPLD